MDNLLNNKIRYKIIDTFSKWIAFSGTRSGCPIKSRDEVYPLINKPDYDIILKGNRSITKQEFNEWHENNTALITQEDSRLPIGWSAKLINLYLKTMVYVGLYGRPTLIEHIHPPIDNGLLKGIKEEYRNNSEIINKTHSKTKIKDITNYQDYRKIIDGMELIANNENCLLIEVEHLWKGTEYKK